MVILCGSGLAMAQRQPVLRNNVPNEKKKIAADTIRKDSLKTDTTLMGKSVGMGDVDYSADDSIKFDKISGMIYLHGNAWVKYQGFELSAGYIQLDKANTTLYTRGFTDPKTGKYVQRPIFKQDGDTPKLSDSLYYNYVTKKGRASYVSSEVEGGYLQAEKFKKNQFEEVSIRNGRYSTCNLPYGHQHYYIVIKKGIVFEKQIVTGPAYLVIEDVPIPAIIPFGFFPKVNKRSSGILFPTFGEEGTRGFYMRDLGYYIGLNEYWDAEVRGSLYSKGSYEGSLLARYRRNYKYDGSLNFHYASTRTGIEGTPGYKPSKDFNIQWSHTQRNEANPGTSFGASVNIATGKYFSITGANGTYDVSQLTRNNLNSSISYGRTFGDGKFNFTSALIHSQDLVTKNVSLTLPSFSLNMNSVSPFAKKVPTGNPAWYEKLTVGYTADGLNFISTTENQLFKKETLKKFTNVINHSIPLSYSQNVFRYFQFNLSVPYAEGWTFNSIRKRYDSSRDTVITDTVQGFKRVSTYSFGSGLSTKVYGTVHFKKGLGRITDIRHTMTPTIGFSYVPDFSTDKRGYYRSVQTDATGKNFQRYSIFEGTKVTTPSSGRQGNINFSVDNTVEAKRRTKGDTTATEEKIPLIQGLSFSGSYNMVADSFKLSFINFTGRTSIFKQKLGLNFNGTFDPYALSATGLRINQYALKNGTLARLTSLGFSTDFSFNSAAAKSRNTNAGRAAANRANMTATQTEELNRISRDPNAFVDFNVPWDIRMAYSFNYSKATILSTITNTLTFQGSVAVTPLWQVQYNSGYDFQAKQLSLTRFSIYRDLHCWDLSFTWVPYGQYRSYSVDLKVKASILQDLKLSRRRDYFNNF